MTDSKQQTLGDTSRLEALGAMTQEVDADNPTPEAAAEAQAEAVAMKVAESAAKSWGMIMYSVGGFATMIAPELKPIYSDERCFEWGQAAHAVAEKHGMGAPTSMPEITLLVSTLGFAIPTVFAVKEKIKQAKDGTGPQTWMTKLGLWWRTRKARAQAKAMAAVQPETDINTQTGEATNGSK